MPDADFICPNCGAEVPAKAKACPDCGADEKTGWSEDTVYDGTGIEAPEDFDYEDWKRREVQGRQPRHVLIAVVVVVLVIGLLLLLFR